MMVECKMEKTFLVWNSYVNEMTGNEVVAVVSSISWPCHWVADSQLAVLSLKLTCPCPRKWCHIFIIIIILASYLISHQHPSRWFTTAHRGDWMTMVTMIIRRVSAFRFVAGWRYFTRVLILNSFRFNYNLIGHFIAKQWAHKSGQSIGNAATAAASHGHLRCSQSDRYPLPSEITFQIHCTATRPKFCTKIRK